MLNTRLPSPLFTSGVGSLPLASIVSRFAPRPMIDVLSVIASSPIVSRIVPPAQGRGEADRVGAGIRVGQEDRFAERQVAERVVAVRFVGERVDDEIEIAGRLVLERPDVDPAAEHAAKRRAPLIKLRHAAHPGHGAQIARD